MCIQPVNPAHLALLVVVVTDTLPPSSQQTHHSDITMPMFLLLHSQLVLEHGNLRFQLHNPPLSFHLTHNKVSVTLLYLCPKPELLVAQLSPLLLHKLILYPKSEGPIELGSIQIECTHWYSCCQPFLNTGLDKCRGC